MANLLFRIESPRYKNSGGIAHVLLLPESLVKLSPKLPEFYIKKVLLNLEEHVREHFY